MLFTEYLVAFMKILFQFAFAVVGTILFRPAWNCVAVNYLSEWIPQAFVFVPFWHFVAITLVATFLGEQINKLVPKLASVTNNSNNTNTDK